MKIFFVSNLFLRGFVASNFIGTGIVFDYGIGAQI